MVLSTAAGALLDPANKRNSLFLIAVAQLLLNVIHTIPLAATFLYRTRGTHQGSFLLVHLRHVH
jgi:hypothetical protein